VELLDVRRRLCVFYVERGVQKFEVGSTIIIGARRVKLLTSVNLICSSTAGRSNCDTFNRLPCTRKYITISELLLVSFHLVW
jgi:hypothetical protein